MDSTLARILGRIPHAIGLGVRCPICGARRWRFAPSGRIPKPNNRCQNCDSYERHRFLWWFLEHRTDLFRSDRRLLHFAPETALEPRFRQRLGDRYVTTDLLRQGVDVRADITTLTPFADGQFGAVLCSHVFEHIPDDGAAMRQVLRVLAPGAWAAVQVPMRHTPDTFEDPTVTDPAERERLFGQDDHVRWYGQDFPDRLRRAGFTVERYRQTDLLTGAQIRRMALTGRELASDIFLCRKPDPR